ncbi:MAG TPA: helix-turn-helix domain-containing protein, partial [Opitutus sp.]|nr:helix-turn-helix domain-containing protein [Opitutus sp.]
SKVSPEAMAALARHAWAGNVRELENVVYRSAVIAQGDAILVKDLPAEIRAATGEGSAAPFPAESVRPAAEEAPKAVAAGTPAAEAGGATPTLDEAFAVLLERLNGDGGLLARVEDEVIARTVKAEGGDLAQAAKRLGLSKAVLQKKLKNPTGG